MDVMPLGTTPSSSF